MLRPRVATAVVLTALVVSILLLLPPAALAVPLALMFLVGGGWEGARLAGLSSPGPQVAWIAVLCLSGVLLILGVQAPPAPPLIFGAATLGWIGLGAWLGFPEFGRSLPARFQPVKLIVVGLVLLGAFIAIWWLHAASPWRVIYLIGLIAAADIGAYFSGHSFGGPKLAPGISPGKTWSGLVGGLVVATAVAVVASRIVPDIPLGSVAAALVAVVLVAFSVCGDLLISLFKRHRGLKDTSSLLPGHGGLLDRIDSLSAAAPVFALFIWGATAAA